MSKKEIPQLQRSLNVWAIILIIWSVYRAYFRTDLPIWVDEFIAKPIVFILPVYYYITKIEKKKFFDAIGLSGSRLGYEVIVGIIFGLIIFIAAGLGQATKLQRLLFNPQTIFTSKFLTFLSLSFATSISEEILSRGFILKRLYAQYANIFTSSFFASILFFFLHVPILFTRTHTQGIALLLIMGADLIFSFAVSVIFLQRKNLIAPIFIHAFYALGLYLFLAV